VPPAIASLLASLLVVSVGLLACSPADQVPGATTSVATSAAATSASSSATTATVGSAASAATTIDAPGDSSPDVSPACGRFADRRITAMQRELDRLAPVALEELVNDDAAADLSDGYLTASTAIDDEAGDAGCAPDELARAVLDRARALRAQGPIAASAKSSFVDDHAWRVARALRPGAFPPSLIVSGPAVARPRADQLPDCRSVARRWVTLMAAMAGALEGVDADEYLALADIRSIDARDLAAGNDALSFDIDGLREAADALDAAADDLGCTDDAIAAVLLEELPVTPEPSPAASVFLADQIDVALLLVLGF
jgi:hypothetical protein